MESCCIDKPRARPFSSRCNGLPSKEYFSTPSSLFRLHYQCLKLYLLIRAPDSSSAKERFNNEGFIEDKVFPVPGDIACDSLGISSELKDQMCREIDIIVNSAATTRFDERYDTAISVNVLGAMHVLKFSKQCSKLKMLLHVSTAYVCGEKEGLILEKPLNYGETLNGSSHLDIQAEQKLARLHGWPNTYSFTKAMGEMLLGHMKEDLQLIILRPTIILSTYKEPFPGWIEGSRTTDTFIVGYGKGKQKVAMGGRETVADVVFIAAMVAHRNPSSHTVVYHIGSSRRNQFKLGDLMRIGVDYFKKNPWIDKRGKPVKVKKFHLLDSMASLHKYIEIHYMPSLKILKWANLIFCQHLQAQHTNLQRRINHAIRLAELYKPYVLSKEFSMIPMLKCYNLKQEKVMQMIHLILIQQPSSGKNTSRKFIFLVSKFKYIFLKQNYVNKGG
ncbi:hypothetical protein HAX54_043973 [Datura stramonium]|uniref:Fatty acyl-CoA reductase n=1 Tax=Datura stramonium TaxID=4076 RepID=A0ABS8W3K4_DATST|nr:hypothetical protein [Datura stramonium]